MPKPIFCFLDESGDHNLEIIDKSYPIFCLAACIIDFDYYNQIVEKKVDELKIKHFGTRNIILRSYDIRKQKGDFSSLVDKEKREVFYRDLDALIKKIEFKIIAAVIDKIKLRKSYARPSDPYDLCFQFIMERLCMFVGTRNEVVIIRMESRESHNDRVLTEDYEDFKNKGNNMIPASEVRKKLVDLSFNQKMQNIAGHQISDLVAYPIGIHVFKPERKNPAFEIIETKFHTKPNTKQYMNYGLKIFP